VTLEAVLEDLAGAMPEPCDVCGYSMGGRVALHLALARPERVASLTLVGASPGISDAGERAQRLEADRRLADRMEALRIEDLDEEWARTPVLAGQPPGVRAAVREDRLRSTPEGLAAALRGLGAGALPPLWDRLGDLAMPARFLAGERDARFAGIAREMAALAPRASAATIAGAGHAAHLEAPDAVASALEGLAVDP
jgi:2-succinyl-6-hydroxy-2,4-cyclohexadiene-1-carboxylate synthase